MPLESPQLVIEYSFNTLLWLGKTLESYSSPGCCRCIFRVFPCFLRPLSWREDRILLHRVCEHLWTDNIKHLATFKSAFLWTPYKFIFQSLRWAYIIGPILHWSEGWTNWVSWLLKLSSVIKIINIWTTFYDWSMRMSLFILVVL